VRRERTDIEVEPTQQTLDQVLQETMMTFNRVHGGTSTPGSEPMFRFTLPCAEAGRLLWRLAKEGITAATVWPGFRGVRDALVEETYWEEVA
jgi:hypothetical protein